MAIIVFEGLPGGGKSTLIKRFSRKFRQPYVSELMNGQGFEITAKESEDSGTDYFLMNDRKKYDKAKKLSKNNEFVMVDRGTFSTLVYNSCIDDKDNLRKVMNNTHYINEKYDGDVIYFYIMISPNKSLSRKKKRKNRKDIWSYKKNLIRAGKLYDEVFRAKENVVVIDGNNNLETVENEVRFLLKQLTN